MEQVVTTSPAVVARRFPLLLIGFFAVSALTLALVGVYGVVSYAVTRRSGELAIRAALGATGPQLRRPVVRHGGLLAAAGIGIGTMLAGGLTRFLAGTLYGIPATDPVTYVSVALLLLAVTIAATWIPASRAAAAPPAAALKSE
jgi:ABC-type antimicrobial peptide transport system permease subunit